MIVKTKVENLENGEARLLTTEGKKIIWPTDSLPAKTSIGSEIRFALALEDDAESADQELARDILSEILRPEDGDTKV